MMNAFFEKIQKLSVISVVVGIGAVAIVLSSTLATGSMYQNKVHSFKGDGNTFCSGVGEDGKCKVISIAALDYDAKSKSGTKLSSLGKIKLDKRGFVEGQKAKSGWTDMTTYGKFKDKTGKKIELMFHGVSFWANNGGRNWFGFKIKRVTLWDDEKNEFEFTIKTEKLSPSITWPVVTIGNRHILVPFINNLNEIFFFEAPPIYPKAGDKDVIKSAQKRLKELKYYDGPVDGKMGIKTRQAIFDAQLKNSYHLTAKLDVSISKALGIIKEK